MARPDPHAAESFEAWMQANLDGTEYQQPHRDTRNTADQFAEFMHNNLDGQPATNPKEN